MKETTLRRSLALACLINLGAALMAAFPSISLGQEVNGLYVGLVVLFVALFGISYGWLALQSDIDRPLLKLGAIGKVGAFLVTILAWLFGAIPGKLVIPSFSDLALGLYWLWWLRGKK